MTNSMSSSLDDFFRKYPSLKNTEKLAVAVSGGPDSMALSYALSQYFPTKDIYFITVDHGLRDDAKKEAQMVSDWVRSLGNDKFHHTILHWEEERPESAVLEKARQARYTLMADYCQEHKIPFLFVAHHQDDQVETFFIRLAKGSGFDGLAAMRPLRDFNDQLQIARPLLTLSKEMLIYACDENKIPYVNDPTNKKEEFLRPRLRRSMKVLADEGLSTARISTTARRIARARHALEEITDKEKENLTVQRTDEQISFDMKEYQNLTEEIAFRVLKRSIEDFRPNADYHVRMDRVEDLFSQLWYDTKNFKPRTLGGCLIQIDKKKELLVVQKES